MGVNSWALMDESFAMDGVMPPFWAYPDPTEELQQKLLYTTEEFKNFQLHANEKIKKQGEYIDHLIQFVKITIQERDEAKNHLQIVIQERDEAKNQLQILLKKLMSPSPVQHFPITTNCLQPESPQIRQTKNSSSITESDSISDTHNHQSNVSSPVESFFDAATSPDLSNINMANSCQMAVPQQPLFQEYESKSCSAPIAGVSSGVQNYDHAYARIEQLVMKKPLPEKGKLVTSIMEAGPLLQTLLIAGPLPRWRNPPKLMQPLLIPPIPIKGLISKSPNQTAMVNHNILLQNSPIGSHHENSQGVPQMPNLYHSTTPMKRNAALTSVGSYQSLNAKRMKTH